MSNPTALGVPASDCISSSAYGTEQMLRALVPHVGVAAFTLLLPVTYAILAVLLLLTLSYGDVVSLYTKAGGSYIVARDNFGPRVAQVASVALLIDYVVTVAVQTAAGTDAIVSLLHLMWGADANISRWKPEVCVAVVGVPTSSPRTPSCRRCCASADTGRPSPTASSCSRCRPWPCSWRPGRAWTR
ncbi:hypothetical protein [Embleya scabrispora]|uniref:hypothetical protein n=1 Tax=Embleya scabrispora TaxID=159449 RepID=UPI001F1F6758|nr:hypothetical protein [Embleya scabrispora]